MTAITASPSGPGLNLYNLLFGTALKAGPVPGTPVAYAFALEPGGSVAVTGTGFTYGAANAPSLPTGGTIGSAQFLDPAGAPLATWTGLSEPAVLFGVLWSLGGSAIVGNILKGADTIVGSATNDFVLAGLGNDTITGGDGVDWVLFGQDGRTAGITVDLTAGDASDGLGTVSSRAAAGKDDAGEVDVLSGFEIIWATTFADVLIGDAHGNHFTPDAGDDQIDGGAGEDIADYRRSNVAPTSGLDVTFTGGQSAVVKDGHGGTDTLAGIEILLGSRLSDQVTGAAGRQWIIGYDGEDRFDGGAGGDVFQGGAGNDTFIVDDRGDVFIEDVGQGVDLILTTATCVIYKGEEVERLEALNPAGKAAINLFGNEFANTLVGNAGANVLSGGGGRDILRGGRGSDTYGIDNAGDAVVEGKGGAKDRDVVLASVSFALKKGVQVEQLQTADLKLKTAIALTGNEFANALFGDAGANKLDGKLGNDTLIGGKGRDTFIFSTKPNQKSNLDFVRDFSTRDDRIAIENAVFTKVGKPGKLAAKAFASGHSAADASDRVIYDKTNGGVFYDPDGTGPAAQVAIAVLKKGLAVTYADFLVI